MTLSLRTTRRIAAPQSRKPHAPRQGARRFRPHLASVDRMADEERPPGARAAATVVAQPRRHVLVLEASGVLLLVALAVVTGSDPSALILTVPLGGVTVLLLARDALLRPVLTADATSVCVRAGLRPRCFTWSTVARVTTDEGRGGLGGYLVIDSGEDLVQVPAWRLGGNVTALAADLNALRAAGRGQPLIL